MTSSSTASTARRTATFLIRQQRQTQGFREEILAPFVLDNSRWGDPTNGGDLTMLWIPPGRFWMGSPQEDRDRKDTEGPPHLVQLQGFFMGQTPITQAQWQVVAQWQEREGEHWGRELRPNPSYFQLETPQKKGSRGAFGKLPPSGRRIDDESTTG
jgi:formylglycine-generating enzyme required for sulfatase activity